MSLRPLISLVTLCLLAVHGWCDEALSPDRGSSETLTNIAGCLEHARNHPDAPSGREIMNSFEAPVGRGTYFLRRIRGYLHPPVTGQYSSGFRRIFANEQLVMKHC